MANFGYPAPNPNHDASTTASLSIHSGREIPSSRVKSFLFADEVVFRFTPLWSGLSPGKNPPAKLDAYTTFDEDGDEGPTPPLALSGRQDIVCHNRDPHTVQILDINENDWREAGDDHIVLPPFSSYPPGVQESMQKPFHYSKSLGTIYAKEKA